MNFSGHSIRLFPLDFHTFHRLNRSAFQFGQFAAQPLGLEEEVSTRHKRVIDVGNDVVDVVIRILKDAKE
jgi:hypothetical protein